MIRHLSIQNFALIDHWSVDFEAGETAFTGETASGKSLFVSALSYLCGERIDKSLRRNPAEKLVVEAVFSTEDIAFLKEVFDQEGLPWEEDALLVRRELGDSGNEQRINDRRVTQGLYRSLMTRVMDIHSQNAQSLLGSKANYLPLLDQYVGKAAEEGKEALRRLLNQRKQVEEALAQLDLSPEELEREKDLLTYQIREIRQAQLEKLDEEALNQEYKQLVSARERLEGASQLIQAISGGSQPLKYALQSLAQELDSLASKDPALVESKDLLWQMTTEMETLQLELEEYADSIVIDPARIAAIDALFSLLQTLKRKYGQDREEILAYADRAEAKLQQYQEIEKTRAGLEKKKAALEAQIRQAAGQLSQLRQAAGQKLEGLISAQLQQMAVKEVAFQVAFEEKAEIGPAGYDRVDFLISTNPGEPLQSVSQVASGGEMSRFMLSLKIIASEIRRTPILVFDEIDTGLSGRTAQIVAERLASLQGRQIFVISHLPQISALANQHYRIRKESQDHYTHSVIEPLTAEMRVDEIARLIGGVDITELTRSSAREMLAQAEAFRKQA